MYVCSVSQYDQYYVYQVQGISIVDLQYQYQYLIVLYGTPFGRVCGAKNLLFLCFKPVQYVKH